MSQSGHVRFEVLMVASMKMAVFWVVALCSLVDLRAWLTYCLMMEAASTSETSVNFYQTWWETGRPCSCHKPSTCHQACSQSV
jgi:hypothetical protein